MAENVVRLASTRDAPLRQNLLVLKEWLDDARVTEICLNEPGILFVERSDGWTRYEVPALNSERLRDLVQLMATFSGRVCNEDEPFLSGSLPDGERLQVVVPPAVEPGLFSITIRKPAKSVITPEQYEQREFHNDVPDYALQGIASGVPAKHSPALSNAAKALDASGTHDDVPEYSLAGIDEQYLRGLQLVDREMLELRAKRAYWKLYELAVRSHKNIIVAGATGSGKTTFLKTLVGFIEEHERVITIEDTRELELPHANKVHLLFGAKVTPTACMKTCMRMKPDRILPGELRDEAAYDFIQTVTSGHPGALTTIHGGSVWGAFSRLASLVAQSEQGRTMASSGALDRVVRAEIHMVVVVAARKVPDGTSGKTKTVRRVMEIGLNSDPKFRELG
jgi:type IV secretion system protein VirB11